ncbi:hypothetical protein [Leptospira interrogans]|uniref:hypothetical protein n=1 Tax=Leptospira interrogans TaxID=173 RepID=UPI00193C4C24|nr:hypothetical protein [Leptospira interrogans]MBM2888129.1 hypothetical protein [Leptospira interrogans]
MCHRENYWIETITYGDEAEIKWGSVAPVLHDDPLEEMYGDDIEEHMTMGVVFLKWVNAQISDRPSKPK